ncbi:hypothetical protein ASD99_07795 [Mesorhizobium sp. Root695]|nr:hypothetical protein ASD99_07795 [Mesorhizobium sp. Root695]
MNRPSLCNLDEALLHELYCACHGVEIDLDAGEKIGVSPAVDLRGHTAKFDLDALVDEVGNQLLVWVAGGNVARRVIGCVTERDVTRIVWKTTITSDVACQFVMSVVIS